MKTGSRHILKSLILGMATLAFSLESFGDCTTEISNGAVVCYDFSETTGNFVDRVGATADGAGIDLVPANESAIQRSGAGGVQILSATAIRSAGPATKLISACKRSNQITIDAVISSNTDSKDILTLYGPARIVTLSKSAKSVGAFYFGQGYDGGNFYDLNFGAVETLGMGRVDKAGDEIRTETAAARKIVLNNQFQRVVLRKTSSGRVDILTSDSESSAPLFQTTFDLSSGKGVFTSWPDDLRLSLGNESNFDTTATTNRLLNLPNPPPVLTGSRKEEDKDWRGSYKKLAIYCKAMKDAEIVGAAKAPTNWLNDALPVTVDITKDITPSQLVAHRIFKNLTGVTIPIDHKTISDMAAILGDQPNNVDRRLAAAALATAHPGFYNRTVKDFAKRMSNRDESVQVPLNDMTATIVGLVRDSGNTYTYDGAPRTLNAKAMITDDIYYTADPAKAAVPSDLIDHMLVSNLHYQNLESSNYDLSKVLKLNTKQKYYLGDGSTRDVVASGSLTTSDAAGVISSRAFMSAHAIAGTNRRMVEYSLKIFTCAPIEQWRDINIDDGFVGRDVDRTPAGNRDIYRNECRKCHAPMDALKGAFARITFETGFVKSGLVMPDNTMLDLDLANTNTTMSNMVQEPRGIAGKLNYNNTIFPGGNVTTTNSWKNLLNAENNSEKNEKFFGWSATTPKEGAGINSFARMVADSEAFPKCMARRVFRSVCLRDTVDGDAPVIDRMVASFKANGFNLKKLFESMAVQPECLGE